MATKRKMRRYNGGGMPQYDDAEGVDAAVAANTGTGEWARGENYGDNTTPDERVAQARAPRREATAEDIAAITPPARGYDEGAPRLNQTFKQAFAAARSAGDKTFEWEGKKYTTQLASSAQAAKPAPVKPKTEAAPAPKKKYEYEAPLARVFRENRERDATRKESAHLARMHPAPKPRNLAERNERYQNELRGVLGFKKGGAVKASASSRADGIAKRGKTRGTMR